MDCDGAGRLTTVFRALVSLMAQDLHPPGALLAADGNSEHPPKHRKPQG